MGTAAWICFECRAAVRRDTVCSGPVPCPTCKRECTYLGYRIPVPPKQKARAWTALQAQLSRERIGRDVQQHQLEVRRRHELEQEISRLESMPSNPGRTRAITLLRRRLGGPDA